MWVLRQPNGGPQAGRAAARRTSITKVKPHGFRINGFALDGALSIAILMGAAVASAADITYNINRSIGAGSVTGTIVTDGNTGTLALGDIVDWNLTLTDGTYTTVLNSGNSGVFGYGTDLSATPTQLLYDFSTGVGELLFQKVYSSGQFYYCDQTSPGACLVGESITPFQYPGPGFYNSPETGDQVIATAGVPEPSAVVLMLIGLASLGGVRTTLKRD